IRRAPALAAARAQATGELHYHVEELDQRLDALDELFARRASRKPERLARGGDGPPAQDRAPTERGTGAPAARSPGAPPRGLPPPGRDALIAGIAEALLLERALPELLDPAAHAVTVVISQIGATASAGGVAIAAQAIAADAWLDGGAALTDGGQLAE